MVVALILCLNSTSYRTQAETTYKVFPSSQLPGNAEIQDYIKFVSGDTLKPENAFKIDLAKVRIYQQ